MVVKQSNVVHEVHEERKRDKGGSGLGQRPFHSNHFGAKEFKKQTKKYSSVLWQSDETRNIQYVTAPRFHGFFRNAKGEVECKISISRKACRSC